MVDNICRACLRRLNALDDKYLISVIGSASVSVAKQVNLYAMMRENGIVHDFMVTSKKYIYLKVFQKSFLTLFSVVID